MLRIWVRWMLAIVLAVGTIGIVACDSGSDNDGGGGDGGGGGGGGAVVDLRTARGSLAAGDQVLDIDGTLFDSYILNGVSGVVTIDMLSEDFDTYLILFAGDGTNLAFNDDAGPETFNSKTLASHS
ncbi:MAG: hypothetical protein HN383_06095 [Verrucomicrobia bacterium]|nr:hypothetical protein [Verrucomicrobiota bacterium]